MAAGGERAEELNVARLQAYMASPTVLPAAYKKKDLLIYAVGIGCTEDKFTYELCGGPPGEASNRFQMFPTFPTCLFFDIKNRLATGIDPIMTVAKTNAAEFRGPVSIDTVASVENWRQEWRGHAAKRRAGSSWAPDAERKARADVE